jgi:hypothetical protein
MTCWPCMPIVAYWLWLGVLRRRTSAAAPAADQHRRTPPAGAPSADNSRHRHRVLSGEPLLRGNLLHPLRGIFTDGRLRLFRPLAASSESASTAMRTIGKHQFRLAVTIFSGDDSLYRHRLLAGLGRHLSAAPQNPTTPPRCFKRATRWLLRGSILELLVAVPSHVIVRRRDDCCAPHRHILGHRHGNFRDAALLRPGRFLPVRRTISKIKTKICGQKI